MKEREGERKKPRGVKEGWQRKMVNREIQEREKKERAERSKERGKKEQKNK